jgi:hypothetical protein
MIKERNLAILGPAALFVGEWTCDNKVGDVVLKDRWLIRYAKGQWTITRKLHNPQGREVATAVAKNIRVADSKLMFRNFFTKKPSSWADSDTTFERDGDSFDSIVFRWTARGSNGDGKMTRVK